MFLRHSLETRLAGGRDQLQACIARFAKDEAAVYFFSLPSWCKSAAAYLSGISKKECSVAEYNDAALQSVTKQHWMQRLVKRLNSICCKCIAAKTFKRTQFLLALIVAFYAVMFETLLHAGYHS